VLKLRLATARARGAVAVVELDGRMARAAEWRQALARLGLAPPEPGSAVLRRLDCGSGLVDEVLVVGREPRLAELHPAGAPPVVESLLLLLETLGFQHARAASCEERAEEALVAAEGLAGARILLDQAQGALRAELLAWPALAPDVRELRRAALLERARVARMALGPIVVLVAGPVNAGKSSLVNALAGRSAMLVSDQPGTTRDLVRTRARLGPWEVEWIDGAGWRETNAELEREGQRRVAQAALECHARLWLLPHGAGSAPADAIALRSRMDEVADRPPGEDEGGVCALDPAEARVRVRAILERELRLPAEPWPLAGGPSALWDEAGLAWCRGLDTTVEPEALEARVRGWLDGASDGRAH
jgi:tRNA U34 5-carboxymethylaminomethyl modifying GTPase MnmE/TrmE